MKNATTLNRSASSLCHGYWLHTRKPPFLCQIVLPRDLTSLEAERLCAFIMTLVVPVAPPTSWEDSIT